MKKKLKATARQADRRDFVDDDIYDEEPNMKLSRAFFVVLVLHVVAVGGIFVFNKIQVGNDRHNTGEETTAVVENSAEVGASPIAHPSVEQAATTAGVSAQPERYHYMRSGERLIDVASKYQVSIADIQLANDLHSAVNVKVGQRLIIPPSEKLIAPAAAQKAPAAAPAQVQRLVAAPVSRPAVAKSAASGGNTYVVKKGDNPHAIAREHNVDYNELLKLNKIADPRLLQIGQVLQLPPTCQ